MDASDALIAEAFELADASGTELLVKLGKYHVWHGDLSEMRGDSPRTTRNAPELPTSARLHDVALMVEAIKLLGPDRKGLKDPVLAAACKKRLVALYVKLQERNGVATTDGTPG